MSLSLEPNVKKGLPKFRGIGPGRLTGRKTEGVGGKESGKRREVERGSHRHRTRRLWEAMDSRLCLNRANHLSRW